jgi:prevent-host-death family protein
MPWRSTIVKKSGESAAMIGRRSTMTRRRQLLPPLARCRRLDDEGRDPERRERQHDGYWPHPVSEQNPRLSLSFLERSCSCHKIDHLIGQEACVKRVSVADAKAHLSQLVERAAAGETVCITRRGKPVAQITAIDTPRKHVDVAALRALTAAMPVQPETARDFIRRMRDEDRY